MRRYALNVKCANSAAHLRTIDIRKNSQKNESTPHVFAAGTPERPYSHILYLPKILYFGMLVDNKTRQPGICPKNEILNP
jgi:hypothetical protein